MGTSVFLRRWKSPRGDHPHAYGDKHCNNKCIAKRMGSSPRVWGQANVAVLEEKKFRIIPTRMGTRTRYNISRFDVKDHPHAYGDKYKKLLLLRKEEGSSPRVWGQVLTLRRRLTDRRIIPTRMGTSAKGSLKSRYQKDHPHAYGDKRFPLR